MTIKLRAYGIGIPSQLNGVYEFEDGTTVKQAISYIFKSSSVLEQSEAFPDSIILINKKHAKPDDVLREGDLLSVLRTLSGG